MKILKINTKKYKKYILCVMAAVLLFLALQLPSQPHAVVNAANYTSNPNIRVGLIYGSGAVSSFETSATAGQGFIIGQVKKMTGESFSSLLTLNANKISVTRARRYRVEFSGNFSNFSEAGNFIGNLPGTFTNAFPAYINGAIVVRSNSFSTVSEANAFISNTGGYTLKAVVGSQNAVAVIDSAKNATIFEYENGEYDMAVAVASGYLSSPAGNLYTGAFVHRARGAAIEVINLMSLEDYIKGIVSTEISPRWHDEVLKAFAITARTYSLHSGNRHASEGFKLCNDIHCQYFLGLKYATEQSNAAVTATKDLVITYNGKPIEAVYFSSSGGSTETHSDAWGGELTRPYLVSVELPLEKYEDYNNAVWKNIVSPKELSEFLRNTSSYSSRFNGVINGDIAKIKINERSNPSGYIKDVAVTDKNGNTVNIKNSDSVRIAFSRYANSANMDIYTSFSYPIYKKSDPLIETKDLYVLSGNGQASKIAIEADEINILSAKGKKTFSTSEYNFVFDGKGWGHGVGMSQYAAKDLAEAGYLYPEIIKAFYTGITISRITDIAK